MVDVAERSTAVPRTRAERAALLGPLIAQRILVIDGAMGTLIQSYQLDEAGFRGSDPRFADHPRDLRGDNDLLSITQPGIVRAIHDAYLDAGADIIETNTFTATRIAQADYGLEGVVREMNAAARGSRARPPTPARPRSRTGRASSPARSGRRTGPPRSRPTSTTRPPATSRSRSSPRPTRRRRRG
jgi:5-methyltetrahydrofolate--homocysteine methyltransferase